MEKYGFVYIWYDCKHKRYYIGSHWGSEDDGYICSSSWMKKSYKLRPDDFKRRILKRIYTSHHDLLIEEYIILNKIQKHEFGKKYYNLHSKTFNWAADPSKRQSVIEKISQKTKEAMYRPVVREKYLEGIQNRDNRSSDIEVREKRRQTMKKTMAEKFPIEDRKKRLQKDDPKLLEVYKQKSEEMWANRTEEEKKAIGSKISKTQRDNPRPKVECPHCGKIGNSMVMPRWHFDNCKLLYIQ